MLPTLKASATFILEIFLVLGAMAVSLMAEKRFLCAPRMFFVFQQMFMLIYIIFFLNYFSLDRDSNAEVARLLCTFEIFSSACVDLIYLSMLHLTAVESGLSFLAITFFLLAAFFLFAMISISQWIIDPEEEMMLLASRMFSYQIVQVVLFLFCTLCVIRLTVRQDTERKKPLRTFLPHYILTYCSVVLLFIAPKTAFLYAVVKKKVEDNEESHDSPLRLILFTTPIYNLFFVFLINCQDPDRRAELYKSIERAYRGMKTGPIPRISVQEPTSSSNPPRNHIALNIMRNPLNSFTKLQRQSHGAVVEPITAQSNLRVPRDDRYFTSEQEEEEVPSPEEILSSRNTEERGFMTVAMLKRASQISQRFQTIRDSARSESTRTPSQSPRATQETGLSHDQNNDTSPRRLSPSPRKPQQLDVSQLLGFFITSSTSSVAMTMPVRNKRAVERIQEVLHQVEQVSPDLE